MKRTLAVFCAVALILSSMLISPISSASYLIGDLNNDGHINSYDSNLMKGVIVGVLKIEDNRSADLNKDGEISSIDSQLLKRAIVGIYDIEQPDDDEEVKGVAFEEYTVVYPAEATVYEIYAAEILCDWVSDNCGVELTCVDDTAAEVEYEILIGNTNREESLTGAEFANNQYLLKQDGTKLVLQGKDYMIGGAVGELTYYKVNGPVVLVNEITTENEILDYAPVEGDSVILMIGDGMGFNHVAFTQFYLRRDPTYKGFIAQNLPNTGDCITYCLSDLKGDYSFDKITTDSAAAGTALATGWKTQKGYLGQNGFGTDVVNIREVAHDLGYKTGIISTEPLTGATPASFSVHTSSRANDQDIIGQQAALLENGLIDYFVGNSYDNLLADTKEALDVISTDSEGYFIMIEEAYIDKACHKLGAGDYTIGDLANYVRRFNTAIQYAATFTASRPDSVLIITADHETGSITTTGGYDAGGNHSNVNVPVYAMGYGTEIFNDTTVDNTDIADFMASVYGLDTFGGDYTNVNDNVIE